MRFSMSPRAQYTCSYRDRPSTSLFFNEVLGLAGTAWAGAPCNTIRLKLLKIGAQAQVTVRKVWLSLSEAYPYQAIFAAVYKSLRSVRAGPRS
jgi:hypothetical protein